MERSRRLLFVKPPDRFLENEFVYQQLGPHYLQSYLKQYDIESDMLILYQPEQNTNLGEDEIPYTDHLRELRMLFVRPNGTSKDLQFDISLFSNYDVIGYSVMTPQAPAAYELNRIIKQQYPHVISVIGGSHPRYYQEQVVNLPSSISFDFVVPQDGWLPMLKIATNQIERNTKPVVMSESLPKLTDIPPPTRPIGLMRHYNFEIAGAPAYHTITALGCPFTCHFCESGIERVRMFSDKTISTDLECMSNVHDTFGHESKAIMFFDDVGLMSPKQVSRLASLVSTAGLARGGLSPTLI